ncbi:MAG: HypC/HybG/HupF family hydrogenase formation chaperone [Dehalococcoidia bacterium]|nr:MAG: HypC/HybG/HupF family hydrogenase formation chaperone [Dehalococcoidia bacterium]
MCLAVPARVIEISEGVGRVDLAGVVREVSFMLLPDARVGDYILLHAGYALQKVDEAEAEETIRLLAEIAEAGRSQA